MYCAKVFNVIEVFLAYLLTFRSVQIEFIEAFVEQLV